MKQNIKPIKKSKNNKLVKAGRKDMKEEKLLLYMLNYYNYACRYSLALVILDFFCVDSNVA